MLATFAVFAGCSGGGGSVPSLSNPTASPTPGASPALAYCTTEHESPSNGLTLNVTDSSGFTQSTLLIYVQQQASNGGSITWMNTGGTFVAAPVPLPAACYSSTLGSSVKNNPLVIPSGHAGRIYFVYASPAPSSATTPPNPFSSLPNGAQPVNGVAQAPYPYDKIEFNSTSGVVDTTQVDFLGLPLEMQAVAGTSATPLPQSAASPCPAPAPTASPFATIPGPGTVVGVGQCGYAAVYQALKNDTAYSGLVSILPWGTQTIDFRAISPGGSRSFTPFDFNLLGDPSVALPSACTGVIPQQDATYGYLSCVLAQYKNSPRIYQALHTLGGNGDNDVFCISSDGVSNFIATDVSPSTTCGGPAKPVSSSLPKNPFNIPVALFTNAYPAGSPSGACQYAELFNGPFGNANVGAGLEFATADAFTLWKALTLEMNYGTAFEPASHPVETTPPSFQSTPGLFQADPAWNHYAEYVHQYFDGNFAYAISYDDGFSWYSGYSIAAPATVNVRLNPVPTNAPATTANPTRSPDPTCTTYPLGVGTY